MWDITISFLSASSNFHDMDMIQMDLPSIAEALIVSPAKLTRLEKLSGNTVFDMSWHSRMHGTYANIFYLVIVNNVNKLSTMLNLKFHYSICLPIKFLLLWNVIQILELKVFILVWPYIVVNFCRVIYTANSNIINVMFAFNV